jgi:hypothetical protein
MTKAAGVQTAESLIGSSCDAANPLSRRKLPHSYASHADMYFEVGEVAQEINWKKCGWELETGAQGYLYIVSGPDVTLALSFSLCDWQLS